MRDLGCGDALEFGAKAAMAPHSRYIAGGVTHFVLFPSARMGWTVGVKVGFKF